MKFPFTAGVIASVFVLAPPSKAGSNSAQANSVVWQHHRYCLYDAGWNGAGWYRCGFDKRLGRDGADPGIGPTLSARARAAGRGLNCHRLRRRSVLRTSHPSGMWSRSTAALLPVHQPGGR